MEYVLDASAILALLQKEEGFERVTEALAAGSGSSTVNMSEVVARCIRVGMPSGVIRKLIGSLPVMWVEPGVELAYRAGEMTAVTRQFGLSLGDRCCLALAQRESVPAITAEKAWKSVGPLLEITINIIR